MEFRCTHCQELLDFVIAALAQNLKIVLQTEQTNEVRWRLRCWRWLGDMKSLVPVVLTKTWIAGL
ncbi:hypothetical protein KXD40_009446 [Peronospora effusa]|uniref:Uncharacterized protein n=1 Tax=Peronospora effusa TaxID=542832 RepID=A0A3M6VCI5_9STRA|nr:hypothetical protein DD238_007546 [Peronospora effusa]RQM17592.1 hypothetical protein DD237_003130 [Peronospora effusa]UIZ28678.1 hypothetical protein KXD40_009446 [Peronospora effusa]